MDCPNTPAHHLYHGFLTQLETLRQVALQCANAEAVADLAYMMGQVARITQAVDYKGRDPECYDRPRRHPEPCPYRQATQ